MDSLIKRLQEADRGTAEEAVARLLCRQHYGDRGCSMPHIAKIVEEELPHWTEKASEVLDLLHALQSQDPIPPHIEGEP